LGDYLVSQITEAPPPEPEPPKLAYGRTSVLFHPADYQNDSGQPSPWVVALLSAPWWNTQLWTITQSAHDTAITTTDADLLSRRIIAINPEQWGMSPTLEEWLATYFEPGYEYIPIHADTPQMMIAEIERIVLGVPPPPPEFQLISPVEGIPLAITSPFNAPRDYDGDGIFDDKHEGVDLRAVDANGSPVRVLAAAEGVVEQVQNVVGGSYGLYVVIRHDWPDGHTYKTWYAHHSRNLVVVGQPVKAGDPIAIAGMTGNATGIHLHLSLQDIGRGLSGYVLPDIVDPTPFLLPDIEPLPEWTGSIGVGAARSGDMITTEVEALQVARVTAMKGMTNMARDWSVWAQNAGVPQEGLMCRLYFDYSGLGALPTPEQFVTDMRLPINEQRARGCNLFEVGNEPNIELIQFGNAETIADWYDDIYSLLLAEWGNIRLMSPGMSPQTGGQWDTQTWLTAFRDAGILERSYLVGAHCYWHSRSMMFDVAQGWNFSQWQSFLKPGQQMSITEFSNNGAVDSDADIGRQYAEWSAKLPTYVHSAYAFCLSSDDPFFNQRRETWVRQGVITDIARSFGARA
jgi:murein DD-endopeptidase MepM/ murein hydrolase activator NlpD